MKQSARMFATVPAGWLTLESSLDNGNVGRSRLGRVLGLDSGQEREDGKQSEHFCACTSS